jgi:hypothetical protein
MGGCFELAGYVGRESETAVLGRGASCQSREDIVRHVANLASGNINTPVAAS